VIYVGQVCNNYIDFNKAKSFNCLLVIHQKSDPCLVLTSSILVQPTEDGRISFIQSIWLVVWKYDQLHISLLCIPISV
jgi:hypothetical protein